jgi:TetR/AcrR family hemagglutinin/protease transcriptional regulator
MPATVKGRRRLQPDERKKLLLNDAIDVFARRGIGRGGHTEIAQQAGVSVATVFNYFKTRETLVSAVLDEVEYFLLNLAERVYEEAENPVDGIKKHTQAFLRACEENSNHIKIWLEWSAPYARTLGRAIFNFKLAYLISSPPK